jgi:hypothetical protein
MDEQLNNNEPIQTADIKPAQEGFNWKRSLITVAIVILTALVVGGITWYIMNTNADNINSSNSKTVNAMQSNINNLKNKIANLEKEVTSTTSNTSSKATSSASSAFKITELGIQFTPSSTVSDLYYVISNNVADFSTKSLASYGSSCSATNMPLGTVSVSMQAPLSPSDPNYSPDRSAGALVKQIGSEYVYYMSANAPCLYSNNASITLQNTQADAFKASLATVTSIQ